MNGIIDDIELEIPSLDREPERMGDPSKIVLSPIFELPTTAIALDAQVPEFVRQDHPKFLEFMKEYYNWLELKDNTGFNVKRIKQFSDIDFASDLFEEELHKQFLTYLPRNLATNKAQVLKNIRQFYRAKGSEKSFKFFFRSLYNSPAEFYYPRVDILKVSDGKYIKPKSIRVYAISGDFKTLANGKIRGLTTNTEAYIDRIRVIASENRTYYELFLNVSSITGRFSKSEQIACVDGQSTLFLGQIIPSIAKIDIANDPDTTRPLSGLGYTTQDVFKVDFGKGKFGSIQVSSVDEKGSIKKLIVKDFGLDYSTDAFLLDINGSNGSPTVKYSLSQNNSRLSFVPSEYTSTLIVSGFENEQQKKQIETFFVKGSCVKISSPDRQQSALYYISSIFDLYADSIRYTLNPIDFDVPAPSVVDNNFYAESVVGTGARVLITTDSFCDYTGYYISNNGQLSETKYIQDGEFYQQFSYVVYNKESAETYRSYLKDLVHPLGLKFYGGFRDPNKLAVNLKTPTNAPITRKFQQFPKHFLFLDTSYPDFILIKNGEIQKPNIQYSVLSEKKNLSTTKNPHLIRIFGPTTSSDIFTIIYKENKQTKIAEIQNFNIISGEKVFALPSSADDLPTDSQILPHIKDLKAPSLKKRDTEKCAALDGIKRATVTNISKLSTKNFNVAGPSFSSIYRERFRYKPDEHISDDLPAFVARLNEIELLRRDKDPTYNPSEFLYESSKPSVDSWQNTFDDRGVTITYNTYNNVSEKTPITDMHDYWGDLTSPQKQIANTQIRHFKYMIPKSLEFGDVPDVLIMKNGNILRDNYDYLIVGKNNNPWHRKENYSIKLNNTQSVPNNTDVFEIIYRDVETHRIVTKPLLHTPGDIRIEIPYKVTVLSPNSRINILPDSVVSRGITVTAL